MLRVAEHSIRILSLIAERPKYRHDQPWKIQLRLGLGECDDSLDAILYRHRGAIFIEGTSDDGATLLIPNFYWHSLQHDTTLSGEASELSQGVVAFDSAPDTLYLAARLTDNALALPLADFMWPTRRGGLRATNPRPPTKLTSQFGQIHLWSGRTREQLLVGGRKSFAERPQAFLRVKLSKRRRSIPLPVLFEQFRADLVDITRLLTFFSRRQVGCFRISASAKWDDPVHFHEAELWQGAPEQKQDGEDALVNARRMPPGSLDAVYQRFRTSPHKEVIGRTAMYLAEAFSQRQLESQILYAFTGFEGVVNALEEYAPNLVMEPPAFRNFRKKLERGIKDSAADCGLEPRQLRDINKKLGELHRRPFLTRSIEVVTGLGIRWEDLWPGVSQLERALQAGYTRRSTFIHAGHLVDPEASARDAIRIACLTERVVYALLGGEEEWLSPLAYSRWQRMPVDVPDAH